MAATYLAPGALAATGTIGNVTGAAYATNAAQEGVSFQFVVEVAGATPTVTFKYQGSVDGTNWYDVAYVTDANDTVAVATRVVTATGASIQHLSNPVARKYKFYRVVTTANTNVTFRAELYGVQTR